MIDQQAIAVMTKMIALISKHGKKSCPDVETNASREHRRRAWVITCQLAKFAEHAAKSDLCYLLGEDTSETYKNRRDYYRTARQEDRFFSRELHAFEKFVEELENEPLPNKSRTDNDIVLEVEVCLHQIKNLWLLHTDSIDVADAQLTKQQRAQKQASRDEVKERIANAQQELDVLQKLARNRGLVVSINRCRTAIKRIPQPIAKSAVMAGKSKKTPALKMVTNVATPRSKAKTHQSLNAA